MSRPVLSNAELEEYSTASRKTQVVYQVVERFFERFAPRYTLDVKDINRIIYDGRQAMINFNLNLEKSLRDELRTLSLLRLTIEELMDEFVDFLEMKHYSRWKGSSPQAIFVYKLCGEKVISYQFCSDYVENNNADRVANILICMMEHVVDNLKYEIQTVERKIKRELSITKIKRRILD